MTRFKILLFLLTLALLGAVLGGSWWFYTRVFHHDEVVKKEIKQISSNKLALPDPGLRRFDMALEEIQNGNLEEGRDQLYDMLSHFSDSARAVEAKRIIGEMNMDGLFSPNQNKEHVNHVVLPGESLALIANKNQTTVEAIMRANGMMSTGLQPGDHLFIFPVDFQIVVDVNKKTLTLFNKEHFFKEYVALDVKLPPGMKPQPASVKPGIESEISEKAAWYHGNRVTSTDPHFISADKWLMSGKSGFNIRAMPRAKTAAENIVTIEPHAARPSASKATQKGKQPVRAPSNKRPQSKGTTAASASSETEGNDAASSAPEVGVILTGEDIEELFTIIRTKTPVRIVR